jgi:ABC-type sugar transport system ATPase subunit
MPTPPLLIVEGISKRFGSTQALADVSAGVAAGEILAIVGENGAGKSTLVKIMSGVTQPDTGRITLDGRDVSFPDARSAAGAGIHLVHQELALLPERTVVENVFLGQESRGRLGLLDWPAMRRRTREVLGELGVGHLDVSARTRDLSTANQQMAEIARALVRQARLIIMDEPTAALSPEEATHLFAVIRQMSARGVAFIYISHRLDEVLDIADTVMVLKDGRHMATQPAGTLTIDAVISLMVGRTVADLFPDPSSYPAPDEAPLVQVRDLVDPPAVAHASFDLRPGEIVGLYGLEGHGQDEVLACLAGARRPAAGTLTLHGRSRPWRQSARSIKDGFGYVPEDRKSEGLLLDFSSIDNITLPLLRTLTRLGIVDRGRASTAAAAASTAAGVRGQLDRAVSSLSGGNQQKVAIARWIAAGSRVLLLNQPTRGVDIGSKSEIYHLIRNLCAQQRASALVVSREIAELQGLCDRILVMSHGRLAAEHARTASEETILASAVGGAR